MVPKVVGSNPIFHPNKRSNKVLRNQHLLLFLCIDQFIRSRFILLQKKDSLGIVHLVQPKGILFRYGAKILLAIIRDY